MCATFSTMCFRNQPPDVTCISSTLYLSPRQMLMHAGHFVLVDYTCVLCYDWLPSHVFRPHHWCSRCQYLISLLLNNITLCGCCLVYLSIRQLIYIIFLLFDYLEDLCTFAWLHISHLYEICLGVQLLDPRTMLNLLRNY